MMRLCVWMMLGLLATPALACRDDFATYSMVREDGSKIQLFIDKEIRATPDWLAKGDEPPLSLGKAYPIALDWAKKTYARFDSVEIDSIALQRYGCSALHNRWYYIVKFRASIEGSATYNPSHFAAVLFDGSVIAPVDSKAAARKPEPTQ